MKKTDISWIFLVSVIISVMLINIGCEKEDDEADELEPVESTITDIDGNIYRTVTIGSQVWMAENLKTTTFLNGDPITIITDDSQWAGMTGSAYCNYGNDLDNGSTYGRLYNWYAVNDSRKIAPAGWHVASLEEWEVLIDYLGGEDVAGGKLKERGNDHWEGNTGSTNEFGFTALPGGGRYQYGVYNLLGYLAYWWSSTEHSTTRAKHLGITWNNQSISTFSPAEKYFGYSVRCVKD